MVETLAKKYADYAKGIREELHQYPETAFNEVKTAQIIRRELEKMGIAYKVYAKTGTCAEIVGRTDGKCVLLRADIDALPIKEDTNLPFASLNDGFMHACGHDVHTACLLGAAKILNELKSEIKGTVKFVFQPAEEGAGGAEPMIKEGVMENPKVDASFGMHVEPLEKVGNIQIKDGSMMACPDEFFIKVIGKGGHGSAPELSINPILIAGEICKCFSKITEKISSKNPVVVSVCALNSGNCYNVIPDTAQILGTARLFDNDTREKVSELLKTEANKIAENMGGKCEFTYRFMYPPLINDENMNKIVENSAKKLNFVKNVIKLEKPLMIGEDFSYFANLVPSAYFKLGVGNDEICAPIHSSKFNVDNKCFEIGSGMMAKIALEYLDSLQ